MRFSIEKVKKLSPYNQHREKILFLFWVKEWVEQQKNLI